MSQLPNTRKGGGDMISRLELRHIVESAFFPMKCVCTISPFNIMTVQIIDSHTGDEEFTATGIDTTPLTSMRDIVELIHELKGEMKLRLTAPKSRARKTRSW
ncbi:hypothetical protein ALQ50_101050 [Pseudomonas coronafaciens pv. coronafaciens]|nr:hypothetical protein ALQ50_101050 [Pseudomonas coronafaciens pv. coronafaciens]